MHRSSAIGLVLALVLPLCSAQAADGQGNFVIRGVGYLACRDFLTAYQRAPGAPVPSGEYTLEQFLGWSDGYITARNQLTDATYDAVPLFAGVVLAEVMSHVCSTNADVPYGVVLSRVITEARGSALTQRADMVSMTEGGQTFELPVETIRQAQTALRARGLYSGGVDGLYGAGTRTAVQQFQQQVSLPATGALDTQTLVRLLFAAPGPS